MFRRCLGAVVAVMVAVASGIVAIIMAALAIILVAAATGRYTSLYSLVWAEEVSRSLFLWGAFLGGAIACRSNGHFRLDIIEMLFPQKGALATNAVAQVSLAALGVGLIYTGIMLVDTSIGEYTTVLSYPVWVTYIVVPTSGLMMLSICIENLFDMLRASQAVGGPTANQVP